MIDTGQRIAVVPELRATVLRHLVCFFSFVESSSSSITFRKTSKGCAPTRWR
jgi:hypothetical protein